MFKPCSHRFFFPLLLTIAFLFPGCRGDGLDTNATIRVKVKNSHGETIWLERVGLKGSAIVDSARLNQQGEAIFEVRIEDFEFFMLGDGKNKRILLLVEKDEKVALYTDHGGFGEDYIVKGSGGSSLLLDLERKKQKTINRLDSIGQQWIRERYTESNLEKRALFDSLADDILSRHKKTVISFIERYLHSPATIIAMYQVFSPGQPLFTYEDDYPLFKKVSDSLIVYFPFNEHVKDFKKRTEEYKEEKDAWKAREMQLQPGRPAPPLDLFDIYGGKVSLSSLTGKYVLIYFWDARKKESWEYNEQLAVLYEKYRYRGFEICGIFTGEDKSLYYNAIKIDKLPWIHLFSNTETEKQYNVREIPVMLFIDKQGLIVSRNITLQELTARLPWLLPGKAGTKVSIDTVLNP